MNATTYDQFFLQPTDTSHRRYEVLRAIFVDQQSISDVARQFALSYRTVANWTSEFRSQWDAGQIPPFFNSLAEVAPVARRTTHLRPNGNLKLRMWKLCH